MSLDAIGLKMARSVYQNTHRTLAAAGAAWFTTRTISKLGLDPKVTLVFTGMVSVLYHATKPLFKEFESKTVFERKVEKKINLKSRALSLLGLTMVSKDLLKLNLPLYGPFIKACSVAGSFILLFNTIEINISD